MGPVGPGVEGQVGGEEVEGRGEVVAVEGLEASQRLSLKGLRVQGQWSSEPEMGLQPVSGTLSPLSGLPFLISSFHYLIPGGGGRGGILGVPARQMASPHQSGGEQVALSFSWLWFQILSSTRMENFQNPTSKPIIAEKPPA